MPLYFSHADRYLQYTYVLFERTWNSTILLTRTAHVLESLGFHFAPLLLAAFTLSLFCLSVLPFLAIPSPMENVGILLCITSSLFHGFSIQTVCIPSFVLKFLRSIFKKDDRMHRCRRRLPGVSYVKSYTQSERYLNIRGTYRLWRSVLFIRARLCYMYFWYLSLVFLWVFEFRQRLVRDRHRPKISIVELKPCVYIITIQLNTYRIEAFDFDKRKRQL